MLDGRSAALDAQRAAAAVRELTPQLFAAAAGVAEAAGPARAQALASHFERFELRAQAVEQDLSALADGTIPVETAAQRPSDSLGYMGQVVAALNGEANALGIAALPAAAQEPARLLAAVFHAEQDELRAVIDLGDRLEQMQAASNALTESGAALYAALPAAQAPASAGAVGWLASPWLPLVLVLVAVVALAVATLLQRSLASLRRDAEQQSRQNERNQQAILRLLDEMGEPGRRRPDRRGHGHRGQDGRHRRLHQLRDRGPAGAGHHHQRHLREGQ